MEDNFAQLLWRHQLDLVFYQKFFLDTELGRVRLSQLGRIFILTYRRCDWLAFEGNRYALEVLFDVFQMLEIFGTVNFFAITILRHNPAWAALSCVRGILLPCVF